MCLKSNSVTEVAQFCLVLFFLPLIITANLGSTYKYKHFAFATRFIKADVRLQISGLNIHHDCHKTHLHDEQEPHEYVCDAIRQSNEPQGWGKSAEIPRAGMFP